VDYGPRGQPGLCSGIPEGSGRERETGGDLLLKAAQLKELVNLEAGGGVGGVGTGCGVFRVLERITHPLQDPHS